MRLLFWVLGGMFAVVFAEGGALAGSLGEDEGKVNSVAVGREVAFRRSGGNCLACHVIAEGEAPGNLGPPLVAMQARFPNRSDLRARLYDPTRFNPISAMPPFGKHGILTAEEIEAVIDFLYTL